ncbi:MAG: DUF2142 domain-containing protein [Chitinophagaceae bacterium]|nr:DUF2142 domain-containing protein [Chitinophagaceae bacterium]
MNYLLFVIYLIVLCWWLLRIPFITNTGISSKVILGLFLLKIFAGITIGWISIHIYGPGNDYWDVHDFALEEYQLLFSDPGTYFSNLFTSSYPQGYGGLFGSGDSYWNDLEGNILIKIVSVFNIFSRGDYYINSLFFNFIIFFGHVIWYRLFIKIYPGKNALVIIGCFLLPSTLYFASGIHKDGLVFLLLAVLLYSVFQSLVKEKFTLKRILFACFSLFFIFLIRNYVVLALVPALVAWVISSKTKWPAMLTFASIYFIVCLLFFTIGNISNKIKPMEIITAKQLAYLNLPAAATTIKLDRVEPTVKSFVSNLPQALNHSLLRPYIWELPVKSLLPFNMELLIYEILLLIFVFFRRKEFDRSRLPFLLVSFFFVLTAFSLIGYITPNLGSLVRYRSLYLPLIMVPILCAVNWQKLSEVFKIKK